MLCSGSDEVIDRQGAGTLRNQHEETRNPGPVGWPAAGIDENLNDKRHEEKRQGGEPRRQTYHQKRREEVFRERSEMRGDDGIDQGQPVFLAKQIDRAVGDVPAFDLGLSRLPENRGWENAQGEGT